MSASPRLCSTTSCSRARSIRAHSTTARLSSAAHARSTIATRSASHSGPSLSTSRPVAHDARPSGDEELAAITVLALPAEEASAKLRTGPPDDFERDLKRTTWAGVIPLSLAAGAPETDSRVPVGVEVAAYTRGYCRSRAEEPPDAVRVDGDVET